MLLVDASTEYLGHDHLPARTAAGGKTPADRKRYVDCIRAILENVRTADPSWTTEGDVKRDTELTCCRGQGDG